MDKGKEVPIIMFASSWARLIRLQDLIIKEFSDEVGVQTELTNFRDDGGASVGFVTSLSQSQGLGSRLLLMGLVFAFEEALLLCCYQAKSRVEFQSFKGSSSGLKKAQSFLKDIAGVKEATLHPPIIEDLHKINNLLKHSNGRLEFQRGRNKPMLMKIIEKYKSHLYIESDILFVQPSALNYFGEKCIAHLRLVVFETTGLDRLP